MATTDQKVPGNPPAIATIATITTRSGSMPVRRSARNVPLVSAKERLRSEAISYVTSTKSLPGATPPIREDLATTKVDAAVACEEDRGKGRDGARKREKKEEVSEMMDDSIRCFCKDRVEKGEMVCCGACSRWFHLKCMGMKEGADVIKGKEFVCHFCVSSIMMKMRAETVGNGGWSKVK